ncbi:peptidoglycan-binding domain-containing protein [Tersicoccus sp. MR15.9]|uniref:peptidoglycan-binding domain-containing protein n=1 Tax=Tersicoccus mangrovi TaxID=3121635 RepID=UPI002FE5661A
MKRLKLMIGAVATTMAVSGLALGGAAPAQAASCTSYIYGSGGSGPCVANIQKMLNGVANAEAHGDPTRGCNSLYLHYIATDGSWGPRTDTAVRRFQGWTCSKVDGVVGPATWRALCGEAGDHYMHVSPVSWQRIAWAAAKNSGCTVHS